MRHSRLAPDGLPAFGRSDRTVDVLASRRRLAGGWAALSLALAGCVSVPPRDPVVPQPVFDPFVFFAGHSDGTATLRKLFAAAEPVHVHSNGHAEGDVLVLDQTVEEAGKPPRRRQWRLHRTTTGHYAGTLSDAASGVTGDVSGNRLHLAFTMKGGLPTEQWLALSADGQSAHNLMTVSKFGLRVAVLDETIRRAR